MLSNLLGYESPESVAVTSAAERKDMEMIDNKANSLLWATGCTSWFIGETTGQNTIIYPDYEFKFWFRSVLVPWKDMVYRRTTRSGHHMPAETIQLPAVVLVLMSAALGTVVGAQFLDKVDISSAVKMLEGAYQFVSIK